MILTHTQVTKLGKEIARIKTTQPFPEIMGRDWEIMIASAIGGNWQKTSISLLDVLINDTAIEAKTLTVKNPHAFAGTLAAIVGRININQVITPKAAAMEIVGEWNSRVDTMRKVASEGLFVFLLKDSAMEKFAVRSFPVRKLIAQNHKVFWKGEGKNRVLVGMQKNLPAFRWNGSGGQFTIYHAFDGSPAVIPTPKVKLLSTDEILQLAL